MQCLQSMAKSRAYRLGITTATILALTVLGAGFAAGQQYEDTKLLASDAASGDEFGTSLVLDGDVALIGAIRNSNYQGSAYLFRNDAETGIWSEQAWLRPSDGEIYDWFGTSVSFGADVALIGSIGDDDNGAVAFRSMVAVTPERQESSFL